jgi:hypothetical protein
VIIIFLRCLQGLIASVNMLQLAAALVWVYRSTPHPHTPQPPPPACILLFLPLYQNALPSHDL